MNILIFLGQSGRGKFSQSLSENCHCLALWSDGLVAYQILSLLVFPQLFEDTV